MTDEDLTAAEEYVPPGPPVDEELVHQDDHVRVVNLLDEDGQLVATLTTDLGGTDG